MSNCIELTGKTVKLLRERDFDLNGLKSLLDSVAELRDAPSTNPGYCAWWFLSSATQFDGVGTARVAFGEGRSSHTFRDFEQTMMVLAKFVKRPVKWSFEARDIDAYGMGPNNRPSSFDVQLLPGEVVLGF